MISIAEGTRPDVKQLPRCVSPPMVSLLERSWAPKHDARPKMLEWLEVLDAGMRALERDCELCFDSYKLVGGALCDSTQHFQCFGCIGDNISSTVAAGQPVRSDGAIPCRGCGGLYPFASFRRALDDAVFSAWNGALMQTRERELATLFQTEVQRQMTLAEAERYAQWFRSSILTISCPRCHVAFLYEDGCMAMTCRACRCGFCSYCFKDCGEDAHTHTAGCEYNTANRNVFPPGEHNATPQSRQIYFEGVQRVRKTRLLKEKLQALPAPLMREILVLLADDLKQNGMAID
jgi:hypothetical protein